jgi:hypothetical protein
MQFVIHGLTICIEPASEPPSTRLTTQLTWRISRHVRLADSDGVGAPLNGMRVSLVSRSGGLWTRHALFNGDGLACQFLVSPGGEEVHTEALEWVPDSSLHRLFVEPVMRTILWQKGLPSFHAAALAKNGKAIILMGDKGFGKSSLACALLSQGWKLLADDLVRVMEIDRVWHVMPGHAQIKLNTDTASAMGYAPNTLPRRWTGPADRVGNKLIMTPEPNQLMANGVPITGVFILTHRDPHGEDIGVATPSAPEMMHALLAHTTRHPIYRTPPPAGVLSAYSGLMHQATIRRLALPNGLRNLSGAAAQLDRIVLGRDLHVEPA